MTQEQLTSIAAILLSLVFAYVPGIKTWYDTKDAPIKALIMAGMLLVVVAGVFGLACAGFTFAALSVSCTKADALALVQLYILALVANQASYQLFVSPNKSKVAMLLLVALSIVVFPLTARADGPQPYQYAMIQCSGLGTVENVAYANQQFDSQYGYDHQLTTDGQWQASYIARVNQFASSVGCPQVLQDDGTPTGSLTFWYKIYVPNYQRYSQFYATLKANQTK